MGRHSLLLLSLPAHYGLHAIAEVTAHTIHDGRWSTQVIWTCMLGRVGVIVLSKASDEGHSTGLLCCLLCGRGALHSQGSFMARGPKGLEF